MDPPSFEDDDNSDASAEAFRRKFDSIEAQARRQRQSGYDITESDEEDMYEDLGKNDKPKASTADDDDDDSSSSSSDTSGSTDSPKVVRVQRSEAMPDPPAPSPPTQREGELPDDSESPEPPSNMTPRALQVSLQHNSEVSPLTTTVNTPSVSTPSVATRGSNKREKEYAWRTIGWIPTIRKAKTMGKVMVKESMHIEGMDLVENILINYNLFRLARSYLEKSSEDGSFNEFKYKYIAEKNIHVVPCSLVIARTLLPYT